MRKDLAIMHFTNPGQLDGAHGKVPKDQFIRDRNSRLSAIGLRGERDDDRGTHYSFTASKGRWSAGVYAYDLEDAKRKLRISASGVRD